MQRRTQFQGQIALVTGGAAGIGRAVCEALCEQGAIVYAADINDAGLQKLADAAPDGGSITPVKMDVSQQRGFKNAIDRIVDEQGQLDILINNAGIVLGGDFGETSMESIERIININLWSVIYGTKLAYAQMRKQGHGHIANVSSSAGMMPVPNSAVYSAIKHAIVGLSHSLRPEAELDGVKVSVILPGMVESDLWDNADNVKDYDYKKTMESSGMKPITAAEAADAILEGMSINKRSIIFPFLNRVILRAYQLMPNLITKAVVKPLAS